MAIDPNQPRLSKNKLDRSEDLLQVYDASDGTEKVIIPDDIATPLENGNLEIEGGVALDGTLRKVSDQGGNLSPLYLSTGGVTAQGTRDISTNVILGNVGQEPQGRSVVIGDGARTDLSGRADLVAIGYDASAKSSAVAIGDSSRASDTGCISLGKGSEASNTNAISIGRDSDATQADAIAMGNTALASGGNAISIGVNSDATDSTAIAIGSGAQATSANSISIGNVAGLFGIGGNAIAIGNGVVSSGLNSFAIGLNSSASGSNAISLGAASDATNTDAIAIGNGAQAVHASSVAIGVSATTTANNQLAIGSSTSNLGTVTTESVTSDTTWTVKINGTDYKVLLKA